MPAAECVTATGDPLPCEADQQLRVFLEFPRRLPQPETDILLRCVLANPEIVVGERSGNGFSDCRPDDSQDLVEIWAVRATTSSGLVDLPTGAITTDWQQTGESQPADGEVFLEDALGTPGPPPAPGVVSGAMYCDGLARPEPVPGAPWAERRCGREHYDVFFRLTVLEGLGDASFRATAPLAARGGRDFRFTAPTCGDAIRYCGEECDDGEANGYADGCEDTCTLESCGTPVSELENRRPTAADAIHVLMTAVELTECAGCVCNLTAGTAGDDSVSAADALMTLKAATDPSMELACPACSDLVKSIAVPDWNPHITNWWGEGRGEDCGIASGRYDVRSADPAPTCMEVTTCRTCGDYNGLATLEECSEPES